MGNSSSNKSSKLQHSTVGAQIEVARVFDPTQPREPLPGEDTNYEAILLKIAIDGIDPQIKKQFRGAIKGMLRSYRKDDFARLKKHIISIRKLYSSEEANLLDGLVEHFKFGPILIEILAKYRDTDFELVVESLWTIANIVATDDVESEDTKYIVNLGALPILRELLDHPSSDIVEHALWCLGNIADDSEVHRDLIINLEVNDHLIRFLHEDNNVTARRKAAWLLRNMCGGWPRPTVDFIGPLLNIAVPYIQRQSAEDDEVLCNLLHAVSKMCSHSLFAENAESIDIVFESGVMLPICSITLGECSSNVSSHIVRTIGVFLSRCNQDQTRMIVQQGAFRIFQEYYVSRGANTEHIFEGYRTLCSFVSRGPDQVQMVLDDEVLMTSIFVMSIPSSPEMFSSAGERMCIILSQMCKSGTQDQVRKLAAMPLTLRALLLGTMNRDVYVRSCAQRGLRRILELSGCLACSKSIIENAPVENIQNVLNRHPLERLLRYDEAQFDANLAALLVAYGCSPNAKVHGTTNITLAKYALNVNLLTGIRLNQLSVLTILLGPVYFRQHLPKNGIWLPRELWMLFSEQYFQHTGEYELHLWKAKSDLFERMTALKRLKSYNDNLIQVPAITSPPKQEACCTVS